MPVFASFLRTSTKPAVMKNIELPGAPSRTITVLGGKSRRFMRFTTSVHSSTLSPLKSFMRCRKCSGPAGAVVTFSGLLSVDGFGAADGVAMGFSIVLRELGRTRGWADYI